MSCHSDRPSAETMPPPAAPEPLLALRDFCLSFGKNAAPTLRRLSLDVWPGETHALVGESGSGKSLTALSILRLIEGIRPVYSSGSIRFAGQELSTLDQSALERLRGSRIAMVFQEPMSSLNPVYPVGRQIMEPLLVHGKMKRPEARARALQLLVRTGIADAERQMDSLPHQLSGGQRQRVLLAMALACRPELLIADEPTTALDLANQAQVLDLIRDLQKESGMAVLLITHDLPMVRRIAHRVSIMHQGRVVESGATAEIFARPKEAYTRRLLDAVPKGVRNPRAGGPPLLELRQLACRFVVGHDWQGWRRRARLFPALDGVDLLVREGTTLGVVGESGSGKSTLALGILGLVPCEGAVLYHGRDRDYGLTELGSRAFRPLRRDLQIVLQDPFSSLSPRLSVADIIGEGLRVHHLGSNRAERQALVRQALADVELDPELAQRYPHEFSGGQRQRIAIARALVLRPRLLILDEPTSALDATIQKQVLELLKRLQERYELTYIFISHDLRVVRELANRIAVMRRGRVVEQNEADQIFAAPAHEYTRQLFEAAFQA